ncbi:MAG: DEAD/DEAH box helicase [Lactobacillaceae bacterium]|jgi:superfamily II DNA/RNA helicase|nr:DEAD/DEAH box helicase [Lactobacillaceae bacterium]
MSFKELGLSDKTIKAIRENGIEKPTTVQSDVIPSILQGKDVFTIAPQKCGKTTSYVFPLVDIISKHNKQNILIITPSSEESVVVSDRLSVFNRYHNINEATIKDTDENIDDEANVIIGSPDLLIEIVEEGKLDLSNINILVVDDINLIKKNKQLENLEKILDILPADKQNVVYTNRRSKETQDILDRILKAPEEIKVDKAKEQEAEEAAPAAKETPYKPREAKEEYKEKNQARSQNNGIDSEALNLSKKYNSFGGKTPKFILGKSVIVENE